MLETEVVKRFPFSFYNDMLYYLMCVTCCGKETDFYCFLYQVPSRPFGCFLKPVASMFKNSDSGAGLLSFKRKDLIWVLILLFSFLL